MAEKIEITDEMRAVIGIESEAWTYEVTTTSVRAFARGVGYTDLVYFDVEAAQAANFFKPERVIPYHWGDIVGELSDAMKFGELAECTTTIITPGQTAGF